MSSPRVVQQPVVRACVSAASARGHIFFTESRHYVTVSSVTSPSHVTDVRVYMAPSVGRRRRGAVCRLASVYRNDAPMSADAAPFSLYPGNNASSSSSSSNNRSNDDDDNFYDDSRVSLYVVPRDMAAESRDPGLQQCCFLC